MKYVDSIRSPSGVYQESIGVYQESIRVHQESIRNFIETIYFSQDWKAVAPCSLTIINHHIATCYSAVTKFPSYLPSYYRSQVHFKSIF